ncbi:MAG: flagellar motor switch protein FliM [Candidatus Anammoxibacter sp.]
MIPDDSVTPEDPTDSMPEAAGQLDANAILSNDEVDALLSAIHEGDVVVGKGDDSKEHRIRPYDFRQVSRLSRVDKQRLQYIHESAAVNIGGAMSMYLRGIVECRLIALEEISYRNFADSITGNSHVVVLDISPMEGSGLILMDMDIVLNIIDKSLGGPGIYSSSEGNLTEVEATIINTIIRDVIIYEGLAISWKDNIELKWTIERTEADMRVVQIARDEELMMSANFAIDGDLGFGRMVVCLPFASIEEYIVGFVEGDATRMDKEVNEANLRQGIGDVPLWLNAVLGETVIDVSDLFSLKIGDVIRLDNKAKNPLSLTVEGREKYLCRLGVSASKRKAVQIESIKQDV